MPRPTLGFLPARKRVAFGRIELWWMKSFHGVCVPCASVVLSATGFAGFDTSNPAAPPEPVCQPMPAESKSQ